MIPVAGDPTTTTVRTRLRAARAAALIVPEPGLWQHVLICGDGASAINDMLAPDLPRTVCSSSALASNLEQLRLEGQLPIDAIFFDTVQDESLGLPGLGAMLDTAAATVRRVVCNVYQSKPGGPTDNGIFSTFDWLLASFSRRDYVVQDAFVSEVGAGHVEWIVSATPTHNRN